MSERLMSPGRQCVVKPNAEGLHAPLYGSNIAAPFDVVDDVPPHGAPGDAPVCHAGRPLVHQLVRIGQGWGMPKDAI